MRRQLTSTDDAPGAAAPQLWDHSLLPPSAAPLHGDPLFTAAEAAGAASGGAASQQLPAPADAQYSAAAEEVAVRMAMKAATAHGDPLASERQLQCDLFAPSVVPHVTAADAGRLGIDVDAWPLLPAPTAQMPVASDGHTLVPPRVDTVQEGEARSLGTPSAHEGAGHKDSVRQLRRSDPRTAALAAVAAWHAASMSDEEDKLEQAAAEARLQSGGEAADGDTAMANAGVGAATAEASPPAAGSALTQLFGALHLGGSRRHQRHSSRVAPLPGEGAGEGEGEGEGIVDADSL